MFATILLSLVCAFPRGNAENPGVIAPLTPTTKPVSFWWDDNAFHAGDKAYEWKSLNVTPRNGATFKLPLGVIDREEVVLEGTLDDNAPTLRIGSAGPIGDRDVNFKVSMVPKADHKFNCRFKAAGQTPDYLDVTRYVEGKKGEETVFTYTGHGSLSGRVRLQLTETGRRYVYSAEGPYRAAGLLFDYQYVWTDTEKKIMHVVSKTWEEAGGCTIRVSAKDLKTMTMGTWTKSAPAPRGWDKEEDTAFDVNDLPEGFYWMIVDYLDKSGKVVQNDRFRYFKPPERMAWDGTTLGMEDTVPPPWTKPSASADGTFKCWNKTFRFGGKGLVTSIMNGGQELLAEPVAVILDGKPLEFDVKLVATRTASAKFRLTAKGAAVTVDAVCDFDGYVRFSLAYGPGVKSLAWRAAVKREHVSAFDDGRGNVGQVYLGDGSRLDQAFSVETCQFWWCGGLRGLSGGFATLRGTHIRDYSKSAHVVADARALSVETKIVDTPYDGGRRTAAFYIEPTPMKPKDRNLTTLPASKIVGWTGHLCDCFETKYPGFERQERFDKFAEQIKQGKRVFFYNATHALSPDDPFWGWYGEEWTNADSARIYAHESPQFQYRRTKEGRWQYACMSVKSYRDAKLWGVNWYLNGPVPDMKDLYFDVANPTACDNPHHGCVWTDDFGHVMHERDFDGTREFHKRICRVLRAKNADALLCGHIGGARKPCDAFFDYCCMGEFLAWRVREIDSYFEIFTPEMMQRLFVPRSVDMLTGVSGQFRRWRECWAPDLYVKYNPREPKLDRAIRHFLAYARMHDLITENLFDPQCALLEKTIAELGADRTFEAYYTDGEKSVALSAPGPRQLWGRLDGAGKTLLILLNDTDSPVEQTVTAKGLSRKGRDIFSSKTYDFSSGSCKLSLPPRESAFIMF